MKIDNWKLLTNEQVDQYRANGFVAPVQVLATEQALELRERLETFERSQGGPLSGTLLYKTHLLFTWLSDLVRHEKIVDAIEDLYGPNLLCWNTNFFIKEAKDPAFVSWHQDSTYWGLSRPDVVTAWVALSESNRANGAMAVIPGTHRLDQIPHRDTTSSNNMLSRGQEVAVDVNPAEAHTIELQPGEMSLHHVRIIHGSGPNLSAFRRIGLAIRYVPTDVRQMYGEDSATLVRGVDYYGNFKHEPRPTRDLDPAFVTMHKSILDRVGKILFNSARVQNN